MKKIIALLLIVCMMLSLVACGSKTESAAPTEEAKTEVSATPSDEPITLTVWANSGIIPPDELKLPEEERYLNRAIAKFQETYPNVEVEIVNYGDDTMQMVNDFKAAIMAGEGPDIITPFSGGTVLDLSSGLVCMNDYLNDDLLNNMVGWNTISTDFDASKEIWGIPYAGQSVVCIGYNKELVAAAGLDFENNAPQTKDELYAALDAIRDSGVEPFHLDESYSMLLLYNLGMWWEQETTLEGIMAHNTQGTSFTEDQGFLNMLEEYKKFYENGWVNSDTATSADGTSYFQQGKCALFPVGLWDLNIMRESLGDNYDVIMMPGLEGYGPGAIGGCGTALCVANFSNNVDMAVEFAKFLASKEIMLTHYQAIPSVPLRTDITAEDIGVADDPIFKKCIEMSSSIYYWPDNCLSADAGNIYYSNMPSQVLVGTMTPMELAEMMDDAQAD